jgi:hypothetical protein
MYVGLSLFVFAAPRTAHSWQGGEAKKCVYFISFILRTPATTVLGQMSRRATRLGWVVGIWHASKRHGSALKKLDLVHAEWQLLLRCGVLNVGTHAVFP